VRTIIPVAFRCIPIDISIRPCDRSKSHPSQNVSPSKQTNNTPEEENPQRGKGEEIAALRSQGDNRFAWCRESERTRTSRTCVRLCCCCKCLSETVGGKDERPLQEGDAFGVALAGGGRDEGDEGGRRVLVGIEFSVVSALRL
jgi:hypothetical protein